MQDLQEVRAQKQSKGVARGLAISLFAGALFLLSSCSSYDNWGAYGDSYGGGYRSAEPWYDIGRSHTSGRTGSVCLRCHYNPCRCRSDYGARYGYLNSGYGYGSYYGGRGYRDHRDNHDHKKSSSSKKNKSSKDGKYKLTGSNVGRGHPKNYHTLDWYKGRGYNVKDFTLKDEGGKTYKSGSSSHKKNKSSKKHSSSSKKSNSSSSKKSSFKKSNSSKGKSPKLKGAKNRA